MIRTQIQLYPEQIIWLKKHGLKKGISMSHAIRDSVDFYRFHVESLPKIQHKKKKSLSVIGSFSTDIADKS
jgi:hypothetical protein